MVSEILAIENGKELHGFFKKFAIDVEKDRLERTLPRVRVMLRSKKKIRPGYSIRVLLQELDRMIDWRLAEELEALFFKYNSRNN